MCIKPWSVNALPMNLCPWEAPLPTEALGCKGTYHVHCFLARVGSRAVLLYQALQTAVDIMAFHGIFDESLWNQTLHGLMNLKQVMFLCTYLCTV